MTIVNYRPAIRGSHLAKQRRTLIGVMRRLTKPHLRPSGYRTPVKPSEGRFGPSGTRPLLAWSPKDKDGNLTNKSWAIRGAYTLDRITGITEGGPITDDGAGMIVITGWEELPMEDLLKMLDWVMDKFLPIVTAKAA